MLSTAKSAQVVQLFAPPTNPANAENSFYKFRKKTFFLGVNNVRTNIIAQ